MNGKIHFKDWDVYLAWNDGKPFQHLKRQSPGDEIKKIKALCGNVMKNDTNNFLGYIISNDKWQVYFPKKVTCKRCIAEMKKLGL